MTTVFKNGCEKILQIFYKEKLGAFHLRELARRTGLNENSATRFLKVMTEEKLLEYVREGNMKKYSITKGNFVFSIFSVFDALEYEKLPSIRRRAISRFYERLDEKPVFLVLFGSVAKGTYKENSDLDLLAVFNKRIDVRNAEDYAESQTGIKINCVKIGYGDFLNEIKTEKDKLIASAISSGYPLINHIKYYEEVLG